jgi:arabinofuranosyltransferase
LHFIWRQSYFGEWLPNTAKIKAGFTFLRAERGLKYLASLALAVPALALIPLAALPSIGRMRNGPGFGLGALAFVALGLIYSTYVGGDFMAMGRLVVPTLPFFILVMAATGETLGKRHLVLMRVTTFVVLGLLGCFGLLQVNPEWRQAMHFRWNQNLARTELEQWSFMKNEVKESSLLGRALSRYTAPGERLIRGNIGAVGYYSELVILDVNGLVITEVAEAENTVEFASPGHDRRVEASFFRDWQPDYQYATIMPASLSPRVGFTDQWKALLNRGKFALERQPLRAADGFESGTELRLLRDLRE